MNFKNETGYAKRQTYRPPTQNAGQTTTLTDQSKIETQQIASHISSQTKAVQSPVNPNAPLQEPVELQSTNLESASQHFPSNISGLQPQSSISKCFFVN